MKIVTSLQNALVKEAASLQQKKYRDETGLFLVEGEEPCAAAIDNGWECVTLFVQGDKILHPASPFNGGGLDESAIYVSKEILEKISKKDNPQPVIGVFKQRMWETPAIADFHLALEEIRDPGNLGTIMRTAHAVNVRNILLIGPCCDPFNPEVIRASMGSFSAVQVTAMTTEAFLYWQQ
ncbi:MAG: tRNA/rRNA methyltransferase, partial [Alphaproteobacteria bacterium]|nr:tRNA/rRNA methyltransferase [Alphaproteobacteria bacterium]